MEKCTKFNFGELPRDVEQFLFNPSDSKKGLFFYAYIKDYEFEVGVGKDNNYQIPTTDRPNTKRTTINLHPISQIPPK